MKLCPWIAGLLILFVASSVGATHCGLPDCRQFDMTPKAFGGETEAGLPAFAKTDGEWLPNAYSAGGVDWNWITGSAGTGSLEFGFELPEASFYPTPTLSFRHAFDLPRGSITMWISYDNGGFWEPLPESSCWVGCLGGGGRWWGTNPSGLYHLDRVVFELTGLESRLQPGRHSLDLKFRFQVDGNGTYQLDDVTVTRAPYRPRDLEINTSSDPAKISFLSSNQPGLATFEVVRLVGNARPTTNSIKEEVLKVIDATALPVGWVTVSVELPRLMNGAYIAVRASDDRGHLSGLSNPVVLLAKP